MKETVMESSCIQLRAYSKKEVAVLYKISNKSLTKWLKLLEKELGPRVGHFYSPKQMEIIFKEYGIPKMMHHN
jgi:transposase